MLVFLEDEAASRCLSPRAFLSDGHQGSEKGSLVEIHSVYTDHAEELPFSCKDFTRCENHQGGKRSGDLSATSGRYCDFLIVVEPCKLCTDFESIKVMRETRNDLNQTNNAEMANNSAHSHCAQKPLISVKLWIRSVHQEVCKWPAGSTISDEPSDYSAQQIADGL